jgi:uncharacterized Zn finger protein
MQCHNCGQTSDWIGDGSAWSPISSGARHPLYRCEACGNQQYGR